MSEKIIAEYELKTGQFKASVNGIIGDLNRVDAASGKANADVQQDFRKTATVIDNTGKEVDQLGRKMQMSGSKLSSGAKNISSQFSSIAASASSLGAAIGIAFGVETVVNFAKESVAAATALGEVETKTQAIFGGSKNLVDDFAKGAAQSIGQSELAAKNAASTFGIFGKSAGLTGDELAKFSIANTGLASDLASFYDSTPEEAILAIGAALRGENEPIRRYGVLLDDATLRQKALEMGLIKTTKEALTPQNKVLAANAAIWEQTRIAQGDFLKTSDSLANQQRILTANITNLKAALGNELLPTVNALVGGFNDLFTGSFDTAAEKFLKFGNDVDVLGIHPLVNLANTVDSLVGAFDKFLDGDITGGLEDLARAFIDFNSAWNPVIALLDTLAEKTGIYENLGLFNTEADEAAQSAFLLETRMKLFNSAVEKGGEELDIFYEKLQRLALAKGVEVTREKFDQYVKVQRAKLGLDKEENKEENEEMPKKISYYEALNKELKALTESTINIIAKGGNVPQRDIDRIHELEKKLKDIKLIFDRLKEGELSPVTAQLDVVGFDFVSNADKRATAEEEADKRVMASAEKANKFIIGLYNKQEAKIKTNNKTAIAAQLELYNNANDIAQFIGNTVNQIGGLLQQLQQRQSDNLAIQTEEEIDAVNKSLISQKEKEDKIEAIKRNAARKEYELQLKAFKTSQALQISNAVIQTAQAVIAGLTAGLSTGPAGIVLGPLTAAVAAATGAAQIAIIASTPPPPAPGYKDGTPYLKRGKNKAGVDTIPIMANEGEAIIPTDKNAKYPGMASAWIAGKLDDYLIKNFVAPKIIEREEKKAAKEREKMADAIFGTGTGFDDLRLYMAAQKGNKYLEGIYMNTKGKNKKRQIQ